MKKRLLSLGPSAFSVCLLLALMVAGQILAEDWSGPFALIPVSAPEMILEAVDAGTADGTKVPIGHPTGNIALLNKERFFWLHVPDWKDDAGAESVCYARENRMLVATRWGIQVCADDGPTQVILPMPDRSRVIGVCFGGPELNTLFAFCGDKVWRRAVKLHGMGAFSPWTKVGGNPL